jgi:hypothetical protein
MRMSFSRLAAVGAALTAGVTLASCVSSASPMAASGPNPAAIGFPGGSARVHFLQGSPQLNLGVNNLDIYIDNKLAFTNFFYPFAASVPAVTPPVVVGPVTPYIELPIGLHDFRFTQHGSATTVFLETTFTLKANTKYAIIPEGDAGFSSTTVGIFIEPIYATSNGAVAVSYFNASPKAGGTDFWYNCPVGGPPCRTKINGGAVQVGSPAAAAASWKTNVLLLPSTGGQYCFGIYEGGTVTLVPGGASALPGGTDPQNAQCAASIVAGNGLNANFYLFDQPSLPPLVPPGGPSVLLAIGDTNG